MTNGDYIRQMSDEELIDTFGNRICDMIPAEDCHASCGASISCYECKRRYLNAQHTPKDEKEK